MDKIEKLGAVFTEIVENENTFGALWKNIPLGKDAFRMLRDDLPLRVEGELTPYTRIILLNHMLECMPERDCARFIKEVRDYQKSMFPLISEEDIKEDMDIDGYEGESGEYVRKYTIKDLKKDAERIEDYLDTSMSMEEWCRKYSVSLKFDPVERTEEWENCIYDVEKKCDKILKDEVKGMGYCFSYWSTKRSVLAKYGIEWNSPSVMNPRVMFD